MVNFMMAVNRYCADCMKDGEFLPLHFVMVNIHSGMWMCPKTECIFPMNSHLMKDYIEDDMTTEKVLQLTKMGRRRSKGEMKNMGEVTKDSLINLQNISSSTNITSDESSQSTNTTISKYSNSSIDDTVSTISSCTSSKRTVYYPLWENTSLLCWLDAALAMLVLNASMLDLLSDESDCLIGHLFTEYKKILISYNTFFDYNAVQKQMDRLRNNILKFLQPKLLANYGDEDSPLVCLPLVLRTSKRLSEALEISYRCIFKCDSCGFERTDGFKKIVMSLPNTSVDLDFNHNIYFSRGCYKCFTDHQKSRYEIEKYPSVMFVHFPRGVQTKRCWVEFNFVSPDGEQYIVTQIVQYLNKKRHFISWSYSYEEKLWLEADDLKDPVIHHKYKRPRCRPEEVHIVIWERLSFLRTLSVTSKNKSSLDELNSPNSLIVHKGSSPSISLVTSQITPDELPSEDFRFYSRESSRRSSLSSSDNVSACVRGSQPYTSNPFKSVKNIVQKGLRNTPRYEPYISRKIKKEMDKDNISDETGNTLVKKELRNNNNNNMLDYQGEAKDDEISKDDTKPRKHGNHNVSLDFLKGVLSEELNNISDDLLFSTGDKNLKESVGQTTSTMKDMKSNVDPNGEQSLNELYDLFTD